jgi:hypothetical protein
VFLTAFGYVYTTEIHEELGLFESVQRLERLPRRPGLQWQPLVLVEGEKPPYASTSTSMDAEIAWLNTPPKAHHLIYWGGLSPLRRALSDSGQTETLQAVDDAGVVIDGIFTAAARGPHFYLRTQTALYKLTD